MLLWFRSMHFRFLKRHFMWSLPFLLEYWFFEMNWLWNNKLIKIRLLFTFKILGTFAFRSRSVLHPWTIIKFYWTENLQILYFFLCIQCLSIIIINYQRIHIFTFTFVCQSFFNVLRDKFKLCNIRMEKRINLRRPSFLRKCNTTCSITKFLFFFHFGTTLCTNFIRVYFIFNTL